ncbi:MAG: helix-turn-helix transcriptional regulator [Ruminococcaceae bacterium]|nr:helix-turn-helix transcriptional regulator [Oscillospiraceae bacterium]
MYKYNRIKDLREDKDLTQEECAKIAYISKNSYIRYEKGEREPPLDVIINLAKYYNVSLDYIAGLTNDKRGIGYKEENNYKIKQKHSGSGDNVINFNDKK